MKNIENEYKLDKYDMLYTNRLDKRGCGVVIDVRHDLKFFNEMYSVRLSVMCLSASHSNYNLKMTKML